MKIREILQGKGSDVYNIHPDRTVKDAIDEITGHGVGALLVLRDNTPVGIITERDVLRLCRTDAHRLAEVPVSAVMSKDLVVGGIDDDAESALSVMTEKHIRHLPILDGETIVGIVSIGDLVKSQLHETTATVRYLRDYIGG
jgi:CBS domain-containing protein